MKKIFTITGKIGSGKTTLVNTIKNNLIEHFLLAKKYVHDNESIERYTLNETTNNRTEFIFINIDLFNKYLIEKNKNTLCDILNCALYDLENYTKDLVINKNNDKSLENYKLLFLSYLKKELDFIIKYENVVVFLECGYNLLDVQALLLDVFPFYNKKFIYMQSNINVIMQNVIRRDKRKKEEITSILKLQNTDLEYETIADHIYLSKQNNDAILSNKLLDNNFDSQMVEMIKKLDLNINSDYELERYLTYNLYRFID